MAEVIVGFDSAWTDNAKAPGAICALITNESGVRFRAPKPARFAEALALIESWEAPGDLVLVALDQPTRVPNLSGGRPVERVARSLLSAISTGVQPARRGDGGAPMFGDDAPVWPFLQALAAREHPMQARTASQGRWLIEVFPALALPTLAPEFWVRRRAAKYNPAAQSFDAADWPLVCKAVAAYAERLGCSAPAVWLREAGRVTAPRKALQDQLDSVICLLIAVAWRRAPADASLIVGDVTNGYIVTPAEGEPRERLLDACERFRVPVDQPDAFETDDPPRVSAPCAGTPVGHAPPSGGSIGRSSTVDAARLRALLIARGGRTISYGEVAEAFGVTWTQGFGSSLAAALTALGRENRRRSEPQLMALVVNKASRQPGPGFFKAVGLAAADAGAQTSAHRRMCEACAAYAWPNSA